MRRAVIFRKMSMRVGTYMKRHYTVAFCSLMSASFLAGIALESVIPFVLGIVFLFAAGVQARKEIIH